MHTSLRVVTLLALLALIIALSALPVICAGDGESIASLEAVVDAGRYHIVSGLGGQGIVYGPDRVYSTPEHYFTWIRAYDLEGVLAWEAENLTPSLGVDSELRLVSPSPGGDMVAVVVGHRYRAEYLSPCYGLRGPFDQMHIYNFEDGRILWRYSFPCVLRVYSVEWSPDGGFLSIVQDRLFINPNNLTQSTIREIIMFSSQGSKLWQATVEDYILNIPPVTEPSAGGMLAALTFHRDESGSTYTVLTVYSSDGRVLWSTPHIPRFYYDVDWSPDGSRLAVAGGEDGLLVYSSGGELLWTYKPNTTGVLVMGAEWSPDGARLAAVVSWGWNPQAVHLLTGEGDLLWSSPILGPNLQLEWHPSGSMLAVMSYGENITLVDRNGRLIGSIESIRPTSIAWAGGGSLLLVEGTSSGEGTQFYIYRLTASRIHLSNPNTVPANVEVEGPGGVLQELVVPAGEATEIPVAPGSYTIRVRLQPPQNYLGDPSVLGVEQTVEAGPGDNVSLVLPRVESLASTLHLEGVEGVHDIVLRGPDGGEWTLNITALRATPTLLVAPGSYEVTALYPAPPNYLGSEDLIRYPLGTVSLEANTTHTLTLPLPGEAYRSALAAIELSLPSRAAGLTVEASISLQGGERMLNLTLKPGDTVTVYAPPGETVEVVVSYMQEGELVERKSFTITGEKGAITRLDLAPASMDGRGEGDKLVGWALLAIVLVALLVAAALFAYWRWRARV